jgi:hypothetical protein
MGHMNTSTNYLIAGSSKTIQRLKQSPVSPWTYADPLLGIVALVGMEYDVRVSPSFRVFTIR